MRLYILKLIFENPVFIGLLKGIQIPFFELYEENTNNYINYLRFEKWQQMNYSN